MKNLILISLLTILFLGCSQKVTYVNAIVDDNNPIIKRKHYSLIVPDGTPVKWEWIRTIFGNVNVVIHHTLNHFDKNKKSTGSIWKSYSLEIQTRSGENYTFKDSLIFGKTITAGYKEQILVEKEAMEKRNKEYLENRYLNNEYWKKKGIVSAKYSNVNKYLAIEITTKTKYMDVDKYLREYKLYSYSKTGKLKYYEIIISVDIDKANIDDPELLVEYSFEDMLKRSQRSLDSFVASDEDFPEDAPKYQ